jgi:hypothetical protein
LDHAITDKTRVNEASYHILQLVIDEVQRLIDILFTSQCTLRRWTQATTAVILQADRGGFGGDYQGMVGDLLVPVYPVEISDVDNPETTQDTPGPSKTKKTEEVQDIDSTSVNTASISPEQKGDGEEIDGIEDEQKKGEVTLPREEEDPSKKRKVSPPKPSSRKKVKATMTKYADHPHPR